MSQKLIAVDIDEVLAPLHELFFAHHNQEYGTNYPLMDERYFIHEHSGDSHDEVMRKLQRFLETDSYKNIEPLEGAVAALERLSHNFELVVITSRQDIYEESTHRWLEKFFPKLFKAVHFSAYITGEGLKKSKAAFCKELGASYLIDDSLSTIMDCPNYGVNGLLFGSYPWNKAEVLPEGCVRVADWQAVKEYFDAERS